MRYVVALILTALPCVAHAEDFDPETRAQACMSKLLETTQRELEIRAQAITWQHSLAETQVALKAAEARVKALEDKYEPKPAQEISK